MPVGTRRIVRSLSNTPLISHARKFIATYSETLIIGPTHLGAEEIAHLAGGAAGVHRITLVQLAADLARAPMSEEGLAPLSALGMDALAARSVSIARSERLLKYFEPVATLPGFARALA